MNVRPRVLSLVLMAFAIANTIVAVIIFPDWIVGPLSSVDDVRIKSLADVWRDQQIDLPIITVWMLRFCDARVSRYFLAMFVAAALIACEALSANRTATVAIHAMIFAAATILCYIILVGAMMPMAPL